MKNKIICIMLVDDNQDDNFFHEREIKKYDLASIVITKNTAWDALEYLQSKNPKDRTPDLIFLDINMPGMNGWEFLQKYNRLGKEQQSKAVIIMLTTSDNPDDASRAMTWSFVSDYMTKPLNKAKIEYIVQQYFG
jgi:response regulator RpfG family c-di-GMP phosphodiesterase